MRQRLYDHLLARPDGATPDELAAIVFAQPGRDPEFAHRLVALLLEPDARFRFDEVSGRWTVRDHWIARGQTPGRGAHRGRHGREYGTTTCV